MEDMQHDVSLEHVLNQLSTHPGRTGIIPLVALGCEVRMRGTETPGEYRIAVWSKDGNEPHMLTSAETVNALQFAALVKPLSDKNQRILQLQGALMAAEAEKFLKELSASE